MHRERIIQTNENGSKTVTTRITDIVPSPVSYSPPREVVLMEESHVRWPKAREIIPNVPPPSRRRELRAMVQQRSSR